jgi:hypothetical protein
MSLSEAAQITAALLARLDQTPPKLPAKITTQELEAIERLLSDAAITLGALSRRDRRPA